MGAVFKYALQIGEYSVKNTDAIARTYVPEFHRYTDTPNTNDRIAEIAVPSSVGLFTRLCNCRYTRVSLEMNLRGDAE